MGFLDEILENEKEKEKEKKPEEDLSPQPKEEQGKEVFTYGEEFRQRYLKK